MKLVRLDFLAPFWITRVGDWVYLFDYRCFVLCNVITPRFQFCLWIEW